MGCEHGWTDAVVTALAKARGLPEWQGIDCPYCRTPSPKLELPQKVLEALAFAEQKPGGQGVKTGLLMKHSYSPQAGAFRILAAFIRRIAGEA